MRRIVIPPFVLLVASMGAMAVADELKSGPAVGKKAGAFQTKDCTGPTKGKSLCFV